MSGGYYLRKRGGQTERVFQSGRYTAAEKCEALMVLGRAVALVCHPYERDVHSGAGNCWCGCARGSDLHAVMLEPDWIVDSGTKRAEASRRAWAAERAPKATES